eukprot:8735341-Karenia_brevis.AAC.1
MQGFVSIDKIEVACIVAPSRDEPPTIIYDEEALAKLHVDKDAVVSRFWQTWDGRRRSVDTSRWRP